MGVRELLNWHQISVVYLLLSWGVGGSVLANDVSYYEDGEDDKIYSFTVEPSKKGGPFNFGVVVNNEDYTIYRSSMLGKDGLVKLKSYLKTKGLPFPKTIIYMNKNGYKKTFPFFSEAAIEEFQGQFTHNFTLYHSYDYNNRTYLDGHNPYSPSDDIDKSKYLGKNAMRLFGTIHDGKRDGGMEEFLRILHLVLDKGNRPVLFHCLGGRHRTGMVAMTLRYLQGGEWINGKKRKIFILSSMKYLSLKPAQYEYALHNRDLFRMENLHFVEKFSQDPRFKELQDLYGDELRQNGTDWVGSFYSPMESAGRPLLEEGPLEVEGDE